MFIICSLLCSSVWNVPFISVAILFQGDWLKNNNLPQYNSQEYDSDMTFCMWMRDQVGVAVLC